MSIGGVPKRYAVTGLSLLGAMVLALLRTNLSIALVQMTSNSTIQVGVKTEIIPPEFNWNSMEKGLLLGSTSIGSMFAFVGGFLITKLGGATTFGISTALMATFALLTPAFLWINMYIFVLGKIAQGMLESLAIVGIVDTFTHWAPPQERTHLISYYFVGYYFGIAFNYPVSGYMALLFGWRAVFYMSGIVALIWSATWLFFVRNDPCIDKFITEDERAYLKANITNLTAEKVKVPWKLILSSRSTYAYFNECFCMYWGNSFIMYCLPLYVKDMYKMNVGVVGIITSLPVLCSVIAQPIASYIADFLRTNYLSVSKVHKLFIFWGNVGVVILLTIITYLKSFFGSMLCFCLIRVVFSFPDSSYAVLPCDMAGQYAGVLKAVGMSFNALASLLNPLTLGFIVQNQSEMEWCLYFLILCGISMFGVIVFLLFGSTELQPWAIPQLEKITKENEIRKRDKLSHEEYV